MMSDMVKDGDATPKILKQWTKYGDLEQEQYEKLVDMYNDIHGVDETFVGDYDANRRIS
jgi:hypothetical protein